MPFRAAGATLETPVTASGQVKQHLTQSLASRLKDELEQPLGLAHQEGLQIVLQATPKDSYLSASGTSGLDPLAEELLAGDQCTAARSGNWATDF